MYQIKVDDKYSFDVLADKSGVEVNGEPLILDSVRLNEHRANILHKNRSHNIEIVSFERQEKTAKVKVNGNTYTVVIKDQFDQLLKQLGMDNLTTSKILQVKAPMPGLVLSVLIEEGSEVKKGDNLLVLEAMKMENMIKSPTDGVVKKIEIKQGDKVEKNSLLISFS